MHVLLARVTCVEVVYMQYVEEMCRTGLFHVIYERSWCFTAAVDLVIVLLWFIKWKQKTNLPVKHLHVIML